MTDAPDERAPAPRASGRRLRDMAVLLPVALLLLVVPPYIRIFDQEGLVGGVPLLLVYIFALWALAILASGLLSRGLVASEMTERLPGDPLPGDPLTGDREADGTDGPQRGGGLQRGGGPEREA